MRLVIVIPTYNEKENIVNLLHRINLTFRDIRGWTLRVLIVDDNSPDGTADAVRDVMRRNRKVFLLSRSKKTGLGGAYFSGMERAFKEMGADVVGIMDADLSHNPAYIPAFLGKIQRGYEFVVGARYVRGGSIPSDWPLYRKFLSVFGNTMVSVFLGKTTLTDWTSGYRFFNKDVYVKVRPEIIEDRAEYRGYTFNISFAYHAVSEGFKIGQVPIKFSDRKKGKSKLGLEYLFHTPIFLLKTRLSILRKGIVKRSRVVIRVCSRTQSVGPVGSSSSARISSSASWRTAGARRDSSFESEPEGSSLRVEDLRSRHPLRNF
ncbi:MAG: polyprenol monophosphomannose synthase [Candidatus Blackburnbacteria bacterium]|nr:polyprenol monophosphomannose synthase [Candidatus Blackburnbacteria bacterium]